MNKLLEKVTRLDSLINWLFLIILTIYIYLIVVSKTVLFVKNDVACMIIKYSIKVCLVSFLLFTAYHIVTFEFSKKFTILLIAIGLLVVINYYFCKRGTILLFYCFTICAKNYTPKNLFKLFFFAFSFSFFFVLICRVLNIMPDATWADIMRPDGRFRHSLGFASPNVSAYCVVFFITMYINYRREKMRIIEFVILFVFSIILYKLSDTKNGLFTSIIALIIGLIFIYTKSNIFEIIIEKFSVVSFGLGALFSFALTFVYRISPNKYEKLNSLLSGRLRLQNHGIDKFGVTILGQFMDYNLDEDYDTVDSSMVDLLIRYGVVFFILMLAFFTYEAYLACKLKDKWLCFCLLIVAYYAIFDGSLMVLIFNPFSLYLFDNIFKFHKGSEELILNRNVVKVI